MTFYIKKNKKDKNILKKKTTKQLKQTSFFNINPRFLNTALYRIKLKKIKNKLRKLKKLKKFTYKFRQYVKKKQKRNKKLPKTLFVKSLFINNYTNSRIIFL